MSILNKEEEPEKIIKTKLSVACRRGEVTKELLYDIHEYQEQALRVASSFGQLPIIKLLVSEGADIHIMNDAPLRWAASSGQLETVKYFISKGNIPDEHIKQAQKIAKENGYKHVEEYLKQYIN